MKRSRSKRPNRPDAMPAKAAGTSHSSPRRWLFRLAAMVLGPLLFLGVLEAGLRLAGVGHPMSFLLPMTIGGQDCLVENSRFGWRFFGPDMARSPFPLAIPTVKPPDTIRVFVFGESAALGDPQPEFGFARILQALLEGRYPDKHFEVVNTAMTAINSHVILPIARDCASANGDFWIIYMGNNEVVGPYGSGTVFGAQAASLPLVRAGVAFKATRIGQTLGNLARHAQNESPAQSEWGGMRMFQQNQVRQDDPRMATVYHNFQRNLEDIIATGRRHDATVLVSTVARNLKDCGPFASEHRPGLSAPELAQWTADYQNAVHAQSDGRTDDALASLQQALQIDDTFAEALFRAGQCLLVLGRDGEAAHEFELACDLDTLRFRADSRINQIIRNVTTNAMPPGVQLVDSEAILAAQSPHRLPGGEFLYEHVHLNFEGNYLIARALAETIGQSLTTNAGHPWPTAEDCARRLGWNDFTRRAGELDILGRLQQPPFSEQANNRQQYQRVQQQIEQLQSATLPEYLRTACAETKLAAATAPGDWILQKNLALLQQQTGDLAGTEESWRRVVQLMPHNSEAWQNLGLALTAAGHDAEAISAFQQSTRLAPESVASLNSLGELYARENHPEQAAREFEKVLALKPYWGPAHLGLGKALEAMGKVAAAKAEFESALKYRVSNPGSYKTLATFAFSRGWYDAAAANFADALRLDPADPQTRVNLGLTLEKLGRNQEAKAQYREAIRLQPNFAEAHFCLGLQLGEAGDNTAAETQFAEAVRLKPDFLEARLNLGVALASQNLNQQALDQFEAVLRQDPNNQTALARVRALRTSLPDAPVVH